MLVHNIPNIGLMCVKIIIVCLLPFNGVGSIVSHDDIFHIKGSKEVINGFYGSFSWKFKGSLNSLVIKTFNLLEFSSLCIHDIIFALFIVNESSIPEMRDNICHPTVDDMPLRAFAPFHDI